jgi:hypothetical protein
MNIVPTLDEHRAYIYCPTCASMGNPGVELGRDTYQFRCMFGHSWDYSAIQKMVESGQVVRMVKAVVIEKPSDHSRPYQVFMVPATWEKLTQKFSGRLHVTLGTVMDALADDSIIFIEGKDVQEMKTYGIKTGKDIIAAVKSAREMEKQIADLQRQIDLLAPILRAAGLQPVSAPTAT